MSVIEPSPLSIDLLVTSTLLALQRPIKTSKSSPVGFYQNPPSSPTRGSFCYKDSPRCHYGFTGPRPVCLELLYKPFTSNYARYRHT
ncbi:hypothetical protein MBAV_002423 [Candidatus Magnetobacterium bavaricum]|uniref:Uncharacterized protein n=1 Tax=Candidatus Magnetobacterium bavaricum TaxID=29290 RepID=A0A0F3GXH9_9BACT|nr:hypothetical protein MBAV_002423 [Candidatus Magnetobacterium bavaricum]